MGEDDPAALRAHAERCRRLAKTVHDRKTVASLEQSAKEFDEEADKIEGQSSTGKT
jgi:hypothetical protein